MRTVLTGVLAFALGVAVGRAWTDAGAPARSARPEHADQRTARSAEDPGSAAPAIDDADREIVELPAFETPRGDGVFTGRVVRDDDGTPIEGALVTATPDRVVESRGISRAPAGPVQDQDLRRWIEEAHWNRTTRRSARTDADGRFELTGLAPQLHVVRAYKAGFEIESFGLDGSAATPDAEIEFRAKRIVPVEVVVRAPPDASRIRVEVRGGGHGFREWSADHPYVELEPGRCEFRAHAGFGGEYASEPLEVDITEAPNQRVELVLVGKPTLKGRITIAGNLRLPDSLRVDCVSAEGRKEPPTPREFMMARTDGRVERGRYHVRELENGDYFVAVRGSTEKVHYLGRVTVDGVTAHDIELPGPDPDECIALRVTGPDGGALASWRATLLIQQPHVGISGGSMEWPRMDGTRLVQLPHWDPAWGRLDERTTFRIQVTAPGLGDIVQACELGGSAHVQFERPATLRAEVEGFADLADPGQLRIEVRQERRIGTSNEPVDHRGFVEWDSLQPGPTRVSLIRGRSVLLSESTFDLKPGPNVARLKVPRVHRLQVTVPGVDAGSVWVKMSDQHWPLAPIDADGLAEFELPAGEYEIGYGDKRKTTVRVPDHATATLR